MDRVTVAWLAEQGVRFEFRGASVECYGPRDRDDVYAALRRDVASRAAAFVELLERLFPGAPAEPPTASREPGTYSCCGEPVVGHRRGMCALCVAAWNKALVVTGRQAA